MPVDRKWFDRWRGRYVRGVLLLATAAAVICLPALWPDKRVEICADGKVVQISTSKRTVGQALAEAGIRTSARDLVVPGQTRSLAGVNRIQVYRDVPLQVTADGVKYDFHSPGPSVADALKDMALNLGPDDEVLPGLETAVRPGLHIRVVRVTYQEEVVREPVPYPVERRMDERLPVGIDRIVRRGQEGVQEVSYRVKMADGRRVSAQAVGARMVREPVPELVAAGSASTISRGGRTIRFSHAMEMLATAYTPGPESCGPNATGYTYTGIKAGRGVVAVDPKVIPLGTRLYVDGYGFALAADIGGAIKGRRVDVCYETLREADRWGTRRVIVYVLR